MKKIIIITLLLVIAAVGAGVGLQTAALLRSQTFQKEILPAATRTIPAIVPQNKTIFNNTETEPGVPQLLRIPKINVEAHIESVGLDAEKRMDVPKNADNAAWYNLGYKPGEKGNAVVSGHFDRITGEPAVFYNVSQLQAGDSLYIVDSNGKEYVFVVTQTATYPYNDFPLQQVFGSSSQKMLNLITCEGAWDSSSRNYSHRVVVYSELAE